MHTRDIPNGQSNMVNSEKLADGTHADDKQNTNTT